MRKVGVFIETQCLTVVKFRPFCHSLSHWASILTAPYFTTVEVIQIYNQLYPWEELVVSFITARRYASALYAMVVCPSVCPSVTSRCSTKMAKHRKMQTTPHNRPGTLVFWCQKSLRKSTGVTLYGGAKCRWGRSKLASWLFKVTNTGAIR